jgi:hypothetical protein
MSFRCGAGEQVVNGSMIGTLAADKMSAAPILQFRLAAGHQIPEAFEGQAPGTLATTTSAGTEQSALSGKLRISAEEPSEIKARAF